MYTSSWNLNISPHFPDMLRKRHAPGDESLQLGVKVGISGSC
jgi:hypothetical protein